MKRLASDGGLVDVEALRMVPPIESLLVCCCFIAANCHSIEPQVRLSRSASFEQTKDPLEDLRKKYSRISPAKDLSASRIEVKDAPPLPSRSRVFPTYTDPVEGAKQSAKTKAEGATDPKKVAASIYTGKVPYRVDIQLFRSRLCFKNTD